MAATSTRLPQEKAKDGFVEIEGSVATGFEEAAETEAREKFKTTPRRGRGNVTWDVPLKDVGKVLKMGSIDNVRAVIHTVNNMGFTDDETESMVRLRQLVVDIDWGWLVEVWKQFFQFDHQIRTTSDVPKESLCQVVLSSQIKKTQNQPKAGGGKGGKKGRGKQAGKSRETQQQQEKAEDGQDTATVEEGDAAQESIPKEGVGKEETAPKDVEMADGEGAPTQDSAGTASDQVPQDPAADNISANSAGAATKETTEEGTAEAANEAKPSDVPSFRVTCNRSGECHSFDSMGAAANFGGAIQDYLNWTVNLKKFDIEVLVNIEDQKVMICVALTKESLHRRLLTSFGPTTLRPTIAYNMLRLCHPEPGDIILDPMCGTGSIPIQGAVSWRRSYFFGGEINANGLKKTMENVTSLNEKYQKEDKQPIVTDAVQWDACHLPLKTASIDVIISDLPFGKRMGNKQDNRTLYPRIVQEMTRVARPETGRLCLLTQDRKCLTKVLQSNKRYWQHRYINGVNIGGLSAAVYLMIRTAEAYQPSAPRPARDQEWRRGGPWRGRGPRGPGGGEGPEAEDGGAEPEAAADGGAFQPSIPRPSREEERRRMLDPWKGMGARGAGVQAPGGDEGPQAGEGGAAADSETPGDQDAVERQGPRGDGAESQ